MSSDTNASFSALGLPNFLLETLNNLGYETPSPIQRAAIPELLSGRDMLGMAQTGTGKTAAFALPIIAALEASENRSKAPSSLVLAPTRELAQQVAKAFESYGKGSRRRPKVLPIYGGAPYTSQIKALKAGVDIVVGTPGRLMDHMRKGNLDVSALSTLVLDEADEMLRMGFIDDVDWILSHTPDNRQIALFSATMPKEVARIAREHLNDPVEVKIDVSVTTADTIRQRCITVQPHQKQELLARLLEVEETDAVMVFTRTKIATSDVADALRQRGFAAEALSGDLSQEQRDKTVKRLKSRRIDVVVATDVAARGLDVERISHVINYDIPHDPEAYVHRIGRTGRAGRSGDAILFAAPREKRMLRLIEKVAGGRIEEMAMPSTDDINRIRQQRLKEKLLGHLGGDTQHVRKMLSELSKDTGLEISELAVALAAELSQGSSFLLTEKDQLSSPAKKSRTPNERSAKGGTDTRSERRTERPKRSESKNAKATEKDANLPPMERFRIEVGHDHGVQPGNIVGAIANEVDISSDYIGRIDIREDHSFIDLPEGMPKPVYRHLRNVWVCGKKLELSRVDDGSGEGNAPLRKAKKPARKNTGERKPRKRPVKQ